MLSIMQPAPCTPWVAVCKLATLTFCPDAASASLYGVMSGRKRGLLGGFLLLLV